MLAKIIHIRSILITLVTFSIIQTRDCVDHIKKLNANGDSTNNKLYNSLAEIKKNKKLTVLTENNSTSYFVYRGEPMGYDYEVLNHFAKSLGVDLEVIVVNDINTILDELIAGKADIVAANITVTNERNKLVNFSEPILQTKQVLIQRKPANWHKYSQAELDKKMIRDPNALIGKKVFIRKNSSFYSRLKSLSEEIGGPIDIVEAGGDQHTEDLINYVANGYIDYTVADENVAAVTQNYYDNIDYKTAISLQQNIAFALHKSNTELLNELNNWINNKKNKSLLSFIYMKYFSNRKGAEERMESNYLCMEDGNLSVYDNAIKTNSKKINWDWRLLAAMIYQESKFDPNAASWAGAYGLMQLIPATAKRFGYDSLLASPIQNMEAGTRFILYLDKYWKNHITDSAERIKFVLASYNVGLGHVIDARNLAIKYTGDGLKWDNNIDYYLLNKNKPNYYNDPVVKYGYCRGDEPYNYVRKILERTKHYRNVLRIEDTKPVLAQVK